MKHVIAIIAALDFFSVFFVAFLAIATQPVLDGWEWELSYIFQSLFMLFIAAIFGLLAWGCLLLVRRSIRKIRSNSLDACRKALAPFGDPDHLLQAVDDLPDRKLGGVDLRFDDQYLAFAKNRDIQVRRLDSVQYFYDYGVGSNMHHRIVVILFTKGAPLRFQVPSVDYTDTVLSELYAKSAFGKWILSGDFDPSYEPFTQQLNRCQRLECDGKP